ncbi:MAG: YbhB/YbcL family Raf kinase inhibitor-like protein [Caulobacteraceae bacterium]
MKRVLLIAAVCASAASAAAQEPSSPVRITAFDRPETQAPAGAPALQIVSSDVQDAKPLLQVFSAYGKNVSPPIAWSGGPAATKAYVLIVQDIDAQDPDSAKPEPLLHWLAYNIPPQIHALNRGIKNIKTTTSPLGMMQGWNSHGSVGYTGPHPPVGAAAHHYVFQVYAVDRKLTAGPASHLDRVLSAMRGHVIARAELTSLYAQPAPKPPAAAPGAAPAAGNVAS